MQNKLLEQKPFVMIAFIERLLIGKFISENEIKTYAEHIKISLNTPYYVVVLLNITAYYDKFTHEILHKMEIKIERNGKNILLLIKVVG